MQCSIKRLWVCPGVTQRRGGVWFWRGLVVPAFQIDGEMVFRSCGRGKWGAARLWYPVWLNVVDVI